MKKLTIIIILIIISLSACRLKELDKCNTFERIYTEASDFEARGITATTDGGFMICGNVDNDIFLMKINEQGEVIFYEQDIIPGSDETCRSIITTANGGFLICGSQESRAYFATYNASGKHLNQSTKNQASTCQRINATNDGRYVFAGSIKNTNNIYNAYVGLIELNNTYPAIVSEYIPTIPRAKSEYAFSAIDSNDGYAVASRSFNQPNVVGGTAAHFFKLRYDMSLAQEEFHDLSIQSDAAHDIIQMDDGNFLMTGTMEPSGVNIFALKVNKNGLNQQLNQYGGQVREIANAIIKANDNNEYVIAGIAGETVVASAADAIYNPYLLKIKGDGSLLWEKTFGESGISESISAVVRSDCGYIAVGQSLRGGQSQVYVVKVDANGNVQ